MPPGKKAGTPLKRLQEQLQAVDVVFEVRDARLPISSTHPKCNELLGRKPRVIVLCKEDLADPHALRKWVARFNSQEPDRRAIALSLKFDRGQDKLLELAAELCHEKNEARKRKGMLPRPVRVAVFGLPNVGKSSLINWMIGKKKAAVANTPGVTRGNSWIRVHSEIELLDTPGILPLVAFRGEQALKLGLCNILPGDHYDVEEVAAFGYELMKELYPSSLDTYHTDSNGSSSEGTAQTEPDYFDDELDPREFLAAKSCLETVAKARSCLKAGGKLDIKRAAGIFLAEFRSGKLSRVVLDKMEAR